jgi:hypothetical protein
MDRCREKAIRQTDATVLPTLVGADPGFRQRRI